MSFASELREEFRRSPVTTLCAPLGVLTGLGGMLVGYLQLKAATGASGPIIAAAVHASGGNGRNAPNGSIALIVIGVFLALTPSFANITRIFYRINRFSAVPFSVLLAAISIFLNRLNAIILGYSIEANSSSQALDNLLFYGTVIVFLAVAGRAPLVDLARSPQSSAKGEGATDEEAWGTLVSVVIAILIWGGLVAWSQRQMASAFLQ